MDGRRRRSRQQRIKPALVLLVVLTGLICLYQFGQLGSLHHTHGSSGSSSPSVLLPDYPRFDDVYLTNNDNRNSINDDNDGAGMSACLLVMDDNHFLIEWLAYHYTVLPLRRLIIAQDPRSRTSSSPILKRWQHRINITRWNDDVFLHPAWRSQILHGHNNNVNYNKSQGQQSLEDKFTSLHRLRQRFFFNECMKTLKIESSNTHQNSSSSSSLSPLWVILIDSDEFVTLNPNWKYSQSILPSSKAILKTKRITIVDLLQRRLRNYKTTASKCIGLPRLLFGTKENDEPYQQQATQTSPLTISAGINVTDFLTLRYAWHAPIDNIKINKIGKTLIDLSRISINSLKVFRTDVHRPIKGVCGSDNAWISNVDSPLVVHHYIGTKQQWMFRHDPRGSRTYERYESYKYIPDSQQDKSSNIRGWLDQFVQLVGPDDAKDLLTDVGRIETNVKPHNASADMEKLLVGLPDLSVPFNITRVS